jgi:hypothetical protein
MLEGGGWGSFGFVAIWGSEKEEDDVDTEADEEHSIEDQPKGLGRAQGGSSVGVCGVALSSGVMENTEEEVEEGGRE